MKKSPYPFWIAYLFSVMIMPALANEIAIKTTRADDTTLNVSVPIDLGQEEYLYADLIQILGSDPTVEFSAWQSTIHPIMRYDPIFKENHRLIDQSTIITFTASLKKPNNVAFTQGRIIYYTNKSKTPVEKFFTIPFQTARPSNSQLIGTKPESQEKPQKDLVITNPENVSKNKIEQIDWFTYFKDIAQRHDVLWIRILIALLLGLLLSLTPCIYPMIPITIGILQAQSAQSVWKNFCLALAYTLGVATTFTALGLAASFAGRAFGSFMAHPVTVFIIVALMIYSSLSLFGFYEIRLPRFLRTNNNVRGGSCITAYVFGTISGTVASPCLSPGLLFMLTLVATLKSFFTGFILLFSFALGLSIPLLIIGTFSGSLKLLPRAGSWMIEIKYISGFILLCMCFYFLAALLPLSVLLGMFALFLCVVGIFYIYHAYILRTIWYYMATIFGMLVLASSIVVAAKALQAYLMPRSASHSRIIWLKNYDLAREQALTKNSKIFIFIHAPLCSECIELEEKFEQSERFIDAINRHVACSCNIAKTAKKSTQLISQSFNILGAPTCFLINPVDNMVIKRWEGGLDDQQFEDLLQTLEQN